jgi:hypothetical protein
MKMKNFKLILLAFCSTMIFSCNDAIDIVQEGELTPDKAYETVGDLNQGLLGVYGTIDYATDVSFASIFTDEVRIGFANGGQGLIGGQYLFVLNPTSGDAAGLWYNNYQVINFSTRIIEAAKNITPAPGEETQYADILAQAHILRAWSHFRLLTYFSEDITDDTALGVILLDFIPTAVQKLPRNTNGEIFALINADLLKESDLTSNGTNANRNLISRDFVKAFRARMALYREDYPTASALANELIASYPLTTRAQYGNIWADLPVAGNDEVISKYDYILGDFLMGSIWASVNSTVSGSPFYEVSTQLNSLLPTSDIRRGIIIHPTADGIVNPVGKYRATGATARLNDVKIFRTSEMYFIRAEAKADAGDYAGVAADLQAVLSNRFSAANVPSVAVPATKQAAFAQILAQRRTELAFEGHRYLDLRRLGPIAGIDINRAPADCEANSACFLSSSDYRFVMPIPITELGANPAIVPQQNPGY